jgi:hypothetical protein
MRLLQMRQRHRRVQDTGKGTPMSDYDEVPGDLGWGPTVVRRVAYEAGMKLEAEVKAGASGPAFDIARDKAAACRAAGDDTGTAFWNEVFDFLATRESVSAGTPIIVLEEGETYKPIDEDATE